VARHVPIRGRRRVWGRRAVRRATPDPRSLSGHYVARQSPLILTPPILLVVLRTRYRIRRACLLINNGCYFVIRSWRMIVLLPATASTRTVVLNYVFVYEVVIMVRSMIIFFIVYHISLVHSNKPSSFYSCLLLRCFSQCDHIR
jgi:hypothetical protein